MSTGQPTNPQIKAEIIEQIRQNGMRVVDAAIQYGFSTKTIYNWLRSRVFGSERNLILELNRVKKENEQLYSLLGRATAELKRPKS